MIPKDIEVHPDYKDCKEDYVPVSGKEQYRNSYGRDPGVDLVLVVKVCRRSPKPKGNDVQWHYDYYEEYAIYDHSLFQKRFAPRVENGQV